MLNGHLAPPDLTPCDFFLWGYMKDKVFSTPPRDVDELREKIGPRIQCLTRTACLHSTGSTRYAQNEQCFCVEREDGHVEGT